MSKKGAYDIVYGTYFAFGFTILRRDMRAREAKDHAICVAKSLKRVICIFFPNVKLKTFDSPIALIFNEITIIQKNRENLGLLAKWVSPQEF